MIMLDEKKDTLAYSGTSEDLEDELLCIIKIIQQEFIKRNENERFVNNIITLLFDSELNEFTKEYMKKNKVI